MNFALEKHISTMDDKVNFFCPGDIQDMIVIGEEVMSTPPSLDSRTNWDVKAEMGVGKEENFHRVFGYGNLAWV
jgi:hypothetical protein